tara:strand:+ start:3439 stop:3735 length:297 start_codon:yes stop_codon:yes gene_type:complete
MSIDQSNFTLVAAQNLLKATETAINNMVIEISKPVDPELSGSGRKAELASIKQTAVDAKEMLVIRQEIEQMIKNASEHGTIEEAQDFSGGFAERYSKK